MLVSNYYLKSHTFGMEIFANAIQIGAPFGK